METQDLRIAAIEGFEQVSINGGKQLNGNSADRASQSITEPFPGLH